MWTLVFAHLLTPHHRDQKKQNTASDPSGKETSKRKNKYGGSAKKNPCVRFHVPPLDADLAQDKERTGGPNHDALRCNFAPTLTLRMQEKRREDKNKKLHT
jgi:hypothetical protein